MKTDGLTLQVKQMRREQAHAREPVEPEDEVTTALRLFRPKTRGDCEGGQRPCPFVSCQYHLYLDVHPSGSIHISNPEVEPEDMKESCALDVADRGDLVLEEVGDLLNITRERIRQIERRGLQLLRDDGGLRDFKGHVGELEDLEDMNDAW